MKIEIQEHCIRCGICLALHQELFRYREDLDCIEPTVDQVPDRLVDEAKQAAADCAVTAIFLR